MATTMRFTLLVVNLLFLVAPCVANDGPIGALLRSMLDGGAIPTEKVFYAAFDGDHISQIPAEDVADFLPVAQRLLADTRPQVQRYALSCFLSVTLRRSLDSAALLGPYIPTLEKTVNDRANPLRLLALTVLSNIQPETPPRILRYMANNVEDKNNSVDEMIVMACTLLKASSDILTRQVISFVSTQNNRTVQIAVLSQLGLLRTDNPDALAFLAASLENEDVFIRRAAVGGVSRLPATLVRSRFLSQLNRISVNPDELSDVRSEAAAAIPR